MFRAVTTPRQVLLGLRRRALTHPEDVAAHLVFADALLSEGDELGAYISATILHGDAELSEELRTRLLGRLRDCTDGWELDYGFLRTVLLAPMRVQTFRSLIGLGEWEGVNHLALPFRSGRRDRAMPAEDVLELVRHPVCSQLRILENLDFDPFITLCDADRTFQRLELVLPRWGVNTPLTTGALQVDELVLRGEFLDAAVGWLRTWGRPVFDRVVNLSTDAVGTRGLQLVTNRPGASLQRVLSPNWSATREGKAWHFDLNTVGLHLMSLFQTTQLCDLMRTQLAPLASRFTVRVPDFPEQELQRIRDAAQGVPVEFHTTGPWPQLPIGDDDAPF